MSNYDYIKKGFDLEHVPVTFFKLSGKYYSQDELDFTGVFDCEYIDHIDSTLEAYAKSFGKLWNHKMHLVVMEHPYGFPVMITANNPHETGYWI